MSHFENLSDKICLLENLELQFLLKSWKKLVILPDYYMVGYFAIYIKLTEWCNLFPVAMVLRNALMNFIAKIDRLWKVFLTGVTKRNLANLSFSGIKSVYVRFFRKSLQILLIIIWVYYRTKLSWLQFKVPPFEGGFEYVSSDANRLVIIISTTQPYKYILDVFLN